MNQQAPQCWTEHDMIMAKCTGISHGILEHNHTLSFTHHRGILPARAIDRNGSQILKKPSHGIHAGAVTMLCIA